MWFDYYKKPFFPHPCFYADRPESAWHSLQECLFSHSHWGWKDNLANWCFGEEKIGWAHSNFLLPSAVCTQWSSQEPFVAWCILLCSAPPGSKFHREEACGWAAEPATIEGLMSLAQGWHINNTQAPFSKLH